MEVKNQRERDGEVKKKRLSSFNKNLYLRCLNGGSPTWAKMGLKNKTPLYTHAGMVEGEGGEGARQRYARGKSEVV